MPAHSISLVSFLALQQMTTIDAHLEKTTGKRLTISRLELNDSGIYTCWARTRLQRAYAEVDLNVFAVGE